MNVAAIVRKRLADDGSRQYFARRLADDGSPTISHRDLLAMVCGDISQQRLHCISGQFRAVKGRGGKLAQ
jgi:hypothetical protein